MLKRASCSLPSPRQRDRSWIEYLEEKIARTMRSMRDSATVPDSSALLGMKPQQATEKTMASKSGANSSSKGQLMKIAREGSNASLPWPKCSRTPIARARSFQSATCFEGLGVAADLRQARAAFGLDIGWDRSGPAGPAAAIF